MKDVTSKPETLRTAVAEAFLSASGDVLDLLKTGKTEKGNALEIARTAGIMAAKKTGELIPFCHPLPITHVDVSYEHESDGVRIRASVKCIAATGVEMEALTAANIAALTLYDMLKPHTPEIEIQRVKLVEKRGGKGDFRDILEPPVKAAVIVLSDSVASGKKEDRAGKAIVEALTREESVEVGPYEVLPDDPDQLRTKVEALIEEGIDLILTVGGTGLAYTDLTVEAIGSLIEREIPGIMEAARAYGQCRTPYAMLSRGISGMIKDTLVITLPGSTRGAKETYEALFPAVLHIFYVLRKLPHPHGYR